MPNDCIYHTDVDGCSKLFIPCPGFISLLERDAHMCLGCGGCSYCGPEVIEEDNDEEDKTDDIRDE